MPHFLIVIPKTNNDSRIESLNQIVSQKIRT